MYQNQGIPLADIFLAAQQMKANQQQGRLRELQMQQAQQQMEAQQEAQIRERDQREAMSLLPEAMQAAAPQNFVVDVGKRRPWIPGDTNMDTPVVRTQSPGNSEMLQTIRSVAPQVVREQEDYQRRVQQALAEENRKNAELSVRQDEAQFKGVSKDWIEAFNQVTGKPLTVENMYEVNNNPGMIRDINVAMEKARAGKAPKTNIQIGPDGKSQTLTTAEQTQQQAKVINARRRLQQLDSIDQSIAKLGGTRELSSWWNSAEAAALNTADRSDVLGGFVSDSTRKRLGARAAAVADLASFRNEIINELSGAAVSESEMKRMVQSIPGPEDSSSVLDAKKATWRRNLQYIDKFGVDALFRGISENRMPLIASEEGIHQPASQISQPAQADPVLGAAMESVRSGKSPAEVVQRLVELQKITPKQAFALRAQLAQQQASAPGGQ
jgi:hypothetical protein